MDEFAFADKPSLHLKNKVKLLKSATHGINKGGDEINQKVLCKDALLDSVGFEITPVDKVVLRSELPVEEVLTRLTVLELNGLVSAVPGGYIRTQ